MRIALLMSHADRSMAGALRDMHFMRSLALLGATIAVFRMHAGRQVEEERFLDGSVSVTFCPSDDPAPIPHRQVSAALVEAVRGFAPDVILFKGLGYEVNAHLHRALGGGARAGLIVGGGVSDPVLDSATFVFGEYPAQLRRHFPRHAAAGTGFVMPKYVDLDLAAAPAEGPVLHDIVNVGGLHDKRKNQADVLPLTALGRVVLVGGGKPTEAMAAAIKAADRSRLKLAGRLPQPDLLLLLKRCRVMVHTSTMDGLPRAVVEAMACGLPVVVYRDTIYGGFTEGQHGFMVGRDALRPAVELLLREEKLRRAMGQRARRYVQEQHGIPAIERTAASFLRYLAGARADA
ncbi:glycosyltransferase family 4 protein [Muricoccus radiodurans]|uniref:glycosyltransferase family 4 protein n=1 Tax=Muricoccus radiodurans TaxID=2231721 RepID=UPI003CF25992